MLFTFKRDSEGRERIYYCGDVLVGTMVQHKVNGATVVDMHSTAPPFITADMVNEAIERADEAGFWSGKMPGITNGVCERVAAGLAPELGTFDICTVDVSVADNAVLSVTLPGDES